MSSGNRSDGAGDRPEEQGAPEATDANAPEFRRVPCAQCGFNISGRKIGEPCPECGTTIGQYPIGPPGSNGKAVASMVLGIVSIATCMLWGIPSIICGPLAIIFAKKARLRVMAGDAPQSSLGMANAGRICGIVGTCVGGLYLVLMILYMIFVIGFIGFAASSGIGGGPVAPTPLPTP